MQSLSQKILILDNVLSENECDRLIQFYKENGPEKQHRDTNVLTLEPTMSISYLALQVVNAFNNFSTNKLYINWCEIVEWPKNSFQAAHTDISNSFTSITYLNNSYSGGKTFFVDDLEVIPKVGRTVYFDGTSYSHGVSLVESDVRYTLAIWYK